jgi:hypothetical protein
VKLLLAILGIGMLVLGWAGIGSIPWLGWFDVAVGSVAIIMAFAFVRAHGGHGATVGTLVLAGVTAIVFIVAMAIEGSSWLSWWTLAFSVAFLVASGESRGVRPGGPFV